MPATERPAVVYVDDEPTNLKVFEASFKMRFRVVTCLGGAAALEVLRSRSDIGVLITDQRMPVMNGVELLETVRLEFPEIQRMILTAYSDMRAVLAAVNRGQVARYYVKPWVREELSSALEDALKIFELQLRVRELHLRMLGSERLAAIGQVSAGIAHELMTPLTYLTQNVLMLRGEVNRISAYARSHLPHTPDKATSDALEELPGVLEDVERGAEHIRQLALNVRTQARGDDAQEHSDLSEVAQFAAKIAGAEVCPRAEMTIEGAPTRVRGGQVMLTQVLLNLIVNAAQAMGEGDDRRGRIAVGWEDAGERGVRAWVKDNGSGIPVELHQKVFEPLFTTRPVGVGTGLGLAICRDLIEGIGGKITLQSVVGEGTTIELWLPRPAPTPISKVG